MPLVKEKEQSGFCIKKQVCHSRNHVDLSTSVVKVEDNKAKKTYIYIYICVCGGYCIVLYYIILYYIIYILYIHIYDSASGFCIFHISAENDSVSVQYFFSRCSQIPDHSRRKFPCPTLLLRGKMFTHGSTTVGPWWLLQRPWLYGQSP